MLVGYARVSTQEQDTALQRAAMGAAGVRVVWEESRSGASLKSRPVLREALALLERGDTLVVYKVDRLARSLADLLRVASGLETRGIGLRSLTEPIDTSTPAGRMIFQLLGVFAEFERSVILERCEAGRKAARERGARFGRVRSLDYAKALSMRAEGLTYAEIGRRLACSQSAVVKACRRVALGLTSIDGAEVLVPSGKGLGV